MNRFAFFALILIIHFSPGAWGAEVRGWVTIYPSYKSRKLPERAPENSAIIIINSDSQPAEYALFEVDSGKNGEFSWVPQNTTPIQLSLIVKKREWPHNFEMRGSYNFELSGSDISLNEIALIETNRIAADQYAIANTKLNSLINQYPCLNHGRSHTAINACWRRNPIEFDSAYPKARNILGELERIKVRDNYRSVFAEKIHLMTLLTMYCAQNKFSTFDQEWIDQENHDRELKEQIFSLYECAKGNGMEVEALAYRDVRSHILSRINDRAGDTARDMLRVWLDTYYSESNTTEATNVAKFITQNEYNSEWALFITTLHRVARRPFFHSAENLTPQAIQDAKLELISP